MNIYINNETREIPDASKIADVLQRLDLAQKGIAIAVNNDVVPRNEWERHQLNELDKLTIIKATQGG